MYIFEIIYKAIQIRATGKSQLEVVSNLQNLTLTVNVIDIYSQSLYSQN